MKFTNKYKKLLDNARQVSPKWFADLKKLTDQNFYNLADKVGSWNLPGRKSYKDKIKEKLANEENSDYYNVLWELTEYFDYLADKRKDAKCSELTKEAQLLWHRGQKASIKVSLRTKKPINWYEYKKQKDQSKEVKEEEIQTQVVQVEEVKPYNIDWNN